MIKRLGNRDNIVKLLSLDRLDFYIDAKGDILDLFNQNLESFQKGDYSQKDLLELYHHL